MRVLLVTNDGSGTRTDPEEMATLMRVNGVEVEQVDIDGVARARVDDVQRIVVAGGDGSIGPSARRAADAELALAVLPTGTANDFARALDLPRDLEDAARLAADPGATTRRVDLARNGDRPFVNAASTGLSVLAAREARPLKPRLGPLAYAVGALKAGLTAKAIRTRVQAGDETVFDGRAWQVVVAGTGHFGGGSSTGATEFDDGQLDVAVVPAGSRLALARRAYGMSRGRLAEQGPVVHARAKEIVVHGPGTFNVDGEVCDCGAEARFAIAGSVEVVTG